MIDSTKLIEFADADFEMLKKLKHKEGEFVLHHNGYFDGFATGVKISKTDTIDKACEWLNEHINDYWEYEGGVNKKETIDDFRKAMEE